MKKVFITGATGFLGYHLVKELSNRGVVVYAMHQPDSPNVQRLLGLEHVVLVSCKLETLEELPNKCLERDFDVFYHLAWQGASGEERKNCSIQIDNIKWSTIAVEVAQQLGCKKMVVSGTVCENQCDAIQEQKKYINSGFYLLAKRTAYEMVRMRCQQCSMPLVWCTFYHPIGKYNKVNQLITNTVWKLVQGEKPQFGPANKWFDVIAAEDLCRGFYLAGEKKLSKDRYFIGSGKPRILKEYLKEVRKIIDAELELEFNVYEDDGLPMQLDWLEDGSFEEETGFEARISFADSVKEVYSWIKETKGR